MILLLKDVYACFWEIGDSRYSMKLSYSKLRFATIMYSAIPVVFFIFGWFSLMFAIVFTACLAFALYSFKKYTNSDDGAISEITISKRTIVIVGVITVVWCLLAGQGGFIHQSSDNVIRNAIFRDMIKYEWPVSYSGEQILSYYIGQWVLPAFFGKMVFAISGSIFAAYLTGNIFLFIWSGVGVYLALLFVVLLTSKGGKVLPIVAVLMFIMFSGLDVVGKEITKYPVTDHIEWWARYFQFSSNSTCLFWVYNQAIVSWLVTMCVINEKKIDNLAFIGIMALPFGPFPFVGIVGICVAKAISIIIDEKPSFKELIKNTFTEQNVLALIAIGVPYAVYYMSNSIVSNDAIYGENEVNVGLRFHGVLMNAIKTGSSAEIWNFVSFYLGFMLLEVGVFVLIIVLHKKKSFLKNKAFFISMIMLLFVPLIQMGAGYDFAMRVSIPFVTYIAIEFIQSVLEMISYSKPDVGKVRNFLTKPVLLLALLIFLVGSVTPYVEFRREIVKTYTQGVNPKVDYFAFESLNQLAEKNNFASPQTSDSLYYQYFARRGLR